MLEHTFLPAARRVRLDILFEACRSSQAHLNQGGLFQYSHPDDGLVRSSYP
jgi:hypothetical protein